MKLRHGFKAEAKKIALKTRSELEVAAFAPLDPYALAELWGIEVRDLDAPDLPTDAVKHFTQIKVGVFSAALIPVGHGSIILENQAHEILRRRSTMAHEMAHVILEHEFEILLATDNGCRSSSSLVETEAAELSGELLIPSEAAQAAARRDWSDQQVAAYFQVSEQMARWRMNATGARKIAASIRRKWR